jgi:mRNA interferase RelE/StbE
MAWNVEITPEADRDLQRLDAAVRRRVLRFIYERLVPSENPRALGLQLKGPEYNKTWRYRVGDYPILAHIEDETVTISVVEVGHRREVYQ